MPHVRAAVALSHAAAIDNLGDRIDSVDAALADYHETPLFLIGARTNLIDAEGIDLAQGWRGPWPAQIGTG